MAAYHEGHIIAYSSMNLLWVNLATGQRVPVIYNASTMRRRAEKNRGWGYQLLEQATALLLEEIGPQAILMARTQNPAYHKMWSLLCENIGRKQYPDGDLTPGSIREIASVLGNVDENLVMRQVYWGRSLMRDTPVPARGLEAKLWEGVDVSRGDAIVLVAPPTPAKGDV
jgi:hypothetical protein